MIFYDFKSGLIHSECHERLTAAFPGCAPSMATVTNWYREFQRGRTSLEDEARSGRPAEVCTENVIQRVRDMVSEDRRRITYEVLQTALGISSGSVQKILHEELGLRKLTSRWIPHLLLPEQKDQRVEWCKFMLKKFDEGKSRRVSEIISGDESWIYSYEPEKKGQSQVWVFPDEQAPTKVVRNRSTGKRMVASFVSRSGSVGTVILQNKKTVNAEWYTTVCLPQIFAKLRERRPKTGLRGILLHHDNASAHTAVRTLDFLAEAGVQLLPHPAYSPDLAPCDFFVFPRVKDHLRGKRFDSAEDAVKAYSEALAELTGITALSCGLFA